MKTIATNQSNWVGKPPNQASQNEPKQDKPEAVMMQPALRQIGTTPCPVCRAKVAVFLTRTKRPFINCGLCSAADLLQWPGIDAAIEEGSRAYG